MVEVFAGNDHEIVRRYVAIINRHWNQIERSAIKDNRAKCLLHGGVTIEARTPKELEEKLEYATKAE